MIAFNLSFRCVKRITPTSVDMLFSLLFSFYVGDFP